MKNSITFSSNSASKKSISSLAAKGRSISLSNGPTLAALSGSMAVTSGEGIQVGPDLTKQQESMQLFERIPIVWTRRRGQTGGVLIAPKATECRFVTPSEPRQEPYISNNKIHYRTVNLDLPNTVKAYYHLVVSEGRLGGIQVRDVFQGRCRVGQFSQSYSKRAGKWSPGNFLKDVYRNVIYFYSNVNSSNVDFILSENALIAKAVPAPVSCGTAGTYEGLTTFSFAVEYVNGSDPYDIELEDLRDYQTKFIFDEIKEDSFAHKTWPKGHTMEGQPITLRDYQVTIVNEFLKNPQCIQEVATGAGKTIMTAALSKSVEIGRAHV